MKALKWNFQTGNLFPSNFVDNLSREFFEKNKALDTKLNNHRNLELRKK